MRSDELILALPSKGSLYEGTLRLLERCFIPVRRDAGGRSYEADLAGLDGVRVRLARAHDIPLMVDAGQAHVGVTGLDLTRESSDEEASKHHVVIEDLGFGRAELVVGVPQTWIDVTSMADLVEVAADLRHVHQRPIRVATKFSRLSSRFFRQHHLTDYRIVESLGATEGAPRSGHADIIVDLSSTGTTLATNGLKRIDDGVVLQSQACLIVVADPGVWTEARRTTLARIVSLLEAALAAGRQRMVRARFSELEAQARRDLELHFDACRWAAVEGGVEVVGRADVRRITALLHELRQLGAVDAFVSEPDLLLVDDDRAGWLDAMLSHGRGSKG